MIQNMQKMDLIIQNMRKLILIIQNIRKLDLIIQNMRKEGLACSRLRYLCLSSLMSGAMGWRGRWCSTSSMFKLGRLAACQHLGENNWKHMNRKKMDQDMDVVRFMDHWTTRTIGTRARKDKTIRCRAGFHQRPAATTRPAATYCWCILHCFINCTISQKQINMIRHNKRCMKLHPKV